MIPPGQKPKPKSTKSPKIHPMSIDLCAGRQSFGSEELFQETAQAFMTQSLQLQASEKSLKKDQQLGFNLSDMELDQAIQIHKGGSLFTR